MPRGSKPKVYPDAMVQDVARLYGGGMTQGEVGAVLGVSQKVVWKLMARHGIAARVAAKRDQTGERNSYWRGSNACYQAFHRRLYAKFGKPAKCAKCGTDSAGHYDYANLSGRYEDITDYLPMCRSCHWKFDKKILNIKHMRSDAGESS